jgi:hypothetical protein
MVFRTFYLFDKTGKTTSNFAKKWATSSKYCVKIGNHPNIYLMNSPLQILGQKTSLLPMSMEIQNHAYTWLPRPKGALPPKEKLFSL